MNAVTDTTILRAIGDFLGSGNDIDPTQVVFNSGTVVPYSNQPLVAGDSLIQYQRRNFSSIAYVIDSLPAAPSYTAEQWLSHVGYSPLRLLTCLDLEGKLLALNLSSAKLQAVRQWIDGITLMAAPNPDALLNNWPSPPYSFAESTGEALQVLQGA